MSGESDSKYLPDPNEKNAVVMVYSAARDPLKGGHGLK